MPAREQLGALLLEKKQPHEALAAYKAELAIYPARLRSLYGAATSAEKMGDRELARSYFAQLVKQTSLADKSRIEVVDAKKFLAD
jgi:tetratricopeptide (TPR) repeat protein